MAGMIVDTARQEQAPPFQGLEGAFILCDRQGLAEFAQELRTRLPHLPLDADGRREVKAQLLTLEAQLSSRRPNSVIISESLRSLGNLFAGPAGNPRASEARPLLRGFVSRINQFLTG